MLQFALCDENEQQLQDTASAIIGFLPPGIVEITTFSAYQMAIKKKIIPYFDEHYPGLLLQKVTPKHIQDYYTYEMEVNHLSANTVIHRHANIRKALQYAFRIGAIPNNPADKIERPKKGTFQAGFYTQKELDHLFEEVKGNILELVLGNFYSIEVISQMKILVI